MKSNTIGKFLKKNSAVFFAVIIIIGILTCLLLGRFDFIFTFLITAALISLGLVVYLKDKTNELNISFGFITCMLALWNIAIFMVWHEKDVSLLFLWLKVAFLAVSLLPSVSLYFSYIFPFDPPKKSTLKKIFIFSPGILIFFLVLTNKVLSSVKIYHGKYMSSFSWGHSFLLLYFLIFFTLTFYNLYQHMRKSQGLQKTQLYYVFFGFLLNALIGIITNMIFPSFGITSFTMIGPGSTVIFIAVTTYSIVRHRLMDVEVVIQKSFIYGIVTAAIVVIYALAIVFSEVFLKKIMGYSSILFSGFITIIIAATFQPIFSFLQAVTSKYFFPGPYDYQKVLRETRHKIAAQIQLDSLAILLAVTFTKIMHVSEVALLILNKYKAKYNSVPINYPEDEIKYKQIEIDAQSPITNGLRATKDVLFDEEISAEILRLKSVSKGNDPKLAALIEIKGEMDQLGGALWVPIFLNDELTGIIFLGSKLSGDTFTLEDINLSMALAKDIAEAFENTNLYEEVLYLKNYTQDILDAMPSGVLTANTSGQIITFNPMATKITGITAEKAINKHYKTIFPPENIISQIIESALKNKCSVNFESPLISKDKTSTPLSLTSTILKNSKGKKTGILLTITDLTGIRALKEKVRQTDKINALGTMAASMAHEIKNPLSSMKVLAQLMPSKYNEKEFREKIIEIVPKEVARIDRVIESLLNFTRTSTPQFTDINLNQLIEKDVKYFSAQANNAGIKINAAYAQIPQIKCDPDQLTQVFSNLLLNAIQSMPEGGDLNIATSEGDKIENILQTVKITVTDTGYGISKETLKKLFDPFFTTKHGGTGLGLTISKNIIDGHGGTISINSAPGKGTTFTIILPVKQKI